MCLRAEDQREKRELEDTTRILGLVEEEFPPTPAPLQLIKEQQGCSPRPPAVIDEP